MNNDENLQKSFQELVKKVRYIRGKMARTQKTAVVWIVDNEKEYRQKAEAITKEVFNQTELKTFIIKWDGGRLPQKTPNADFVILDLDLGDKGRGFEQVKKIPGVTLSNFGGPFIIVWSHFDGVKEFGDMDESIKDRIIRTYWKSIANLKTTLQGLINRFKDEGVIHYKNPGNS